MKHRFSSSVSKYIVVLAFCMVWAMTAQADENIRIINVSGDFDAGSVIEISGEGFGQKFPVLPVVWDDFENGDVGQGVGAPAVGHYDRVSPNIVYTATDPYSGSRAAYEYFDGSVWENGVVSAWIPDEARNSFASMKVKFTSNTGTLAEPSSKLLRLNTWSPDATHGYPNFCVGLRGHIAGLEIATNIGAGWGDPGSETIGSVGTSQFNDPNGEWFSVSIWMRCGDVGVANGMAGREFNGDIVERDNIMTLLPMDGLHDYDGTRSAYFNGHMGLYDSNSLEAVIDEVYADNTFSRVVATGPDNGSYAMQIPQYWSDTTVRVRVNTSNYPTGTQLSLVVYDADNNASDPVTVTVGEATGGGGGGGDEDPPGQPGVVNMTLIN